MELRLSLLAALVACAITNASPPKRRTVNPVVASTTLYPSLDMQGLNRDSCVSVAWEANQAVSLRPFASHRALS